jgi:NodT family efflux transporter outer membrane factor (OMF) lipoprotein
VHSRKLLSRRFTFVFLAGIGEMKHLRRKVNSTKIKGLRDLLLLVLVIGMVAACNPFKPQKRTSPAGELPETFSLYAPGPERLDRWWDSFEDPELNTLIEEALSGSFTLKEAWARLNQAKAQTVQAGAALYPDLNLNAEAFRARQSSDGASSLRNTTLSRGNTDSSSSTAEDYFIGLVSSYELDLWGRIRSEREAVRLTEAASREDLNTAAMSLAAEVTRRWANIISQRMQKRLLEKQLETNSIYLELVELRFRKAMVSALDVYQQKQVVERIKAEIPLVEAQEQLLLHELALLLGKPPRTGLKISRDSLPVPDQVPSTGLPADLLAARPDVRAAGSRLRAADWQVSAARANRLPAVRLTGRATYSSGDLDILFDNWLLSLAGNLTAPIFDGKRRAAEVERTKAVVDERLWAYKRTVLTAIKDVEDALIIEEKQRQHIAAVKLQIDAARKALNEAGERYLKGLNDYLPVLTQIVSVQDLERDLIRRQAELLIARVSLFRSLGGTWMNELQPNEGLVYTSPK